MAHLVERTTTTINDSLGNPVTTYGKAVTVWRKDPDGVWRNVVDIWNSTATTGN
jgi:ketosteroid isomerase-like protein